MTETVFPVAPVLRLPVHSYAVHGHRFGALVRSRVVLWARHLGDDVLLDPGTPVTAAAPGQVVWAETRPGSQEHRNWGGIVIIGHRHRETDEPFFTLYGHLTNLAVRRGQAVLPGQALGAVAAGSSPENGWWKRPHLHFGIYLGPWMDQILPGYARPFEGRTKFSWWRDPLAFVNEYNQTHKHGS